MPIHIDFDLLIYFTPSAERDKRLILNHLSTFFSIHNTHACYVLDVLYPWIALHCSTYIDESPRWKNVLPRLSLHTYINVTTARLDPLLSLFCSKTYLTLSWFDLHEIGVMLAYALYYVSYFLYTQYFLYSVIGGFAAGEVWWLREVENRGDVEVL